MFFIFARRLGHWVEGRPKLLYVLMGKICIHCYGWNRKKTHYSNQLENHMFNQHSIQTIIFVVGATLAWNQWLDYIQTLSHCLEMMLDSNYLCKHMKTAHVYRNTLPNEPYSLFFFHKQCISQQSQHGLQNLLWDAVGSPKSWTNNNVCVQQCGSNNNQIQSVWKKCPTKKHYGNIQLRKKVKLNLVPVVISCEKGLGHTVNKYAGESKVKFVHPARAIHCKINGIRPNFKT